MSRVWKCSAVAGVLLAACAQAPSAASGASQSAPAGAAQASSGTAWIHNGAIACDTFLTPEVLGEIFKNPAGHSKKLSAQACRFSTTDLAAINITLIQAGPAVFDTEAKNRDGATPLPGVGDKAVQSTIGIEAVEGTDRICRITIVPPFGNKLRGEPLARKLGDVCNQLFAIR
jgi:hypothetical protein